MRLRMLQEQRSYLSSLKQPRAITRRHRTLEKRCPLELYQQFPDSKRATPDAVWNLLTQCDRKAKDGRVVCIGGIAIGLLICGENNILANKQKEENRAYVRHFPAANLFQGVRVLFNGAHTSMGEWGKIERRFEFLSSEKRWLLYATNNKKKNWGSSAVRVYYDGCNVATSNAPTSKSGVTTGQNGRITWSVPLKRSREKKFQIPAALVTSKDNRCIILTLDIPAKLLQ